MASTPKHNPREHRFAALNISAYLDRELSPADLQRVRKHLDGCIECQQNLALLKSTVALTGQCLVHPCPRSFTLPASVGAQRTAARRWNTTYAFMRGGMLAVSAMLLLTIGVNILFGTGTARLPGWGSTATAPTYGDGTALTEQVVETQVVEQEVQTSAEASVTVEAASSEMALQSPGEEVVSLAVPQPEASPEPEAGLREGPSATSGAEPTDTVGSAAFAPVTPPIEGNDAPVVAIVPENTAEPRAEDITAQASPATNREMDRSSKRGDPSAPPTAAPAEQAVAAPAEPAVPEKALVLWQVARMMLGILLGLLFILGAGLLWAAHKRQPS